MNIGSVILLLIIILIIIVLVLNIRIMYIIKIKEKKVKEKWKVIGDCHQKRNNLVIKICNCIKKYNPDSKEISEIIEITNKLVKSKSINCDIELNKKLIKRINVLFEKSKGYHELISNNSFINYLKKMKNIDDIIKDNRYFYNEAVTDYNDYIKKVTLTNVIKKEKFLLYK